MPTTHGVLVRHYTPHPALGRHQVLDARSLAYRHHGRAGALRAVRWQPAIPVLNQQDLYAQGISTSAVIPGAPDTDAVGSCTANAAAVALSVLLTPTTSPAPACRSTTRQRPNGGPCGCTPRPRPSTSTCRTSGRPPTAAAPASASPARSRPAA
ncbi:hypothetical protein O1L60_45180 [Streptomyces diastatochromogenes]|nr:hypothetical protein [Streptomyces diastatochromogenes]